MKEAFPSKGEIEVASSLLHLAATSPLALPKSNDITEINSTSKSKSSDSLTVTDSNGSFAEAKSQSHRIKMIIEFRDIMMKLKVVRQRRSKSFCISDCQKISSKKQATSTSLSTFCTSSIISASTSASSCISIDSVSSARSRAAEKMARVKRANTAPAHLRRRAEAIVRALLAHGSASEVRIRQLVGNSPDTSKALRMLLKQEKVKRSGEGGRLDPFIYDVIPAIKDSSTSETGSSLVTYSS